MQRLQIIGSLLLLSLALQAVAGSEVQSSVVSPVAAASVPIVIGKSVVPLNGPWKFHTGDDLRWSDPNFDDSARETVDLTPPPGAHDSDVGFPGTCQAGCPVGIRVVGATGGIEYECQCLLRREIHSP